MGKSKTPTFLVEVPLQVSDAESKHLRAHFEAARCLYNALLGEARTRLRAMMRDPRWQEAKKLPKTAKEARYALYKAIRADYHFSEYALHHVVTIYRTTWIADHIDANTAQTLASRAYHAVNKMCLGQARNVRFKNKGRGLDSVEGKTNKQGIRFVLQSPDEGNEGYLVWGKERYSALIDWQDPVVCHGLKHRIKYTRLVRRQASSPQAQGADREGYRYSVQLALEGVPYRKPKHAHGGTETVGLDIGPSSIAIVTQSGKARFESVGSALHEDVRKTKRLERKLDRQRRANNPDNYDSKGRVRKGRKMWKQSRGYTVTRCRLASQKRKQVAHRKSIQGRIAHEVASLGNTVILEKLSYKAWQKQYGRSAGRHAPGRFVATMKRTVASTGGIVHEVPTHPTKLSQYCHGCGTYHKKPLSQRWHVCECGIGPVQRDLYSAWLASILDLDTFVPSSDPLIWESVETRLRTALEDVNERANAGESFPQSMGIPRARARLSISPVFTHQEPLSSQRMRKR